MKKIGIILNPAARINSKRTAYVLKSLGDTFGRTAILRTTRDKSELPGAVEALRRERIEFLLISGGDGTICNVLTEYVNQSEGAPLPTVLPLMGGTINMIGSDAGLRNSQLAISRKLNDILKKGRPVPVTEMGLIRVTDDRYDKPVYGFSWIDGLLYRFLMDYYNQGAGVQVASVMTIKMIVTLLSNAENGVFKDVDSVVYMDSVRAPHEGHCLIIASGLKKFVFGFDIFAEKSEPGRTFNTVYLRESYIMKNRHTLPLGLYRSLKSDETGNFINKAVGSLRVEKNKGYIIDGEIFRNDEPGQVLIEAGPTVNIFSLRGQKEQAGQVGD